MGRCAVAIACMVAVSSSACLVVPGRTQWRQVAVDSVSNSCGRFPETCAAAMGKESTAAGALSAASVYQLANAAARLLDEALARQIDHALEECADLARSEVLIRRGFRQASPTEKECLEEVTDSSGQKVTRAMQLGQEMHALAEQCAERKLAELRPGGFSIEQRYRYDSRSGVTTPVLRNSPGDLRGTLVPDIVVHDGSPANVLEVYDFKFPCLTLDDFMGWRRYTDGPFRGRTQGEVYEEAFHRRPLRVQPRLGVDR